MTKLSILADTALHRMLEIKRSKIYYHGDMLQIDKKEYDEIENKVKVGDLIYNLRIMDQIEINTYGLKMAINEIRKLFEDKSHIKYKLGGYDEIY